MIPFWPNHLQSFRRPTDLPSQCRSFAIVEHDLRNHRDHLNDLWRQLLGIDFRLRTDPGSATALELHPSCAPPGRRSHHDGLPTQSEMTPSFVFIGSIWLRRIRAWTLVIP